MYELSPSHSQVHDDARQGRVATVLDDALRVLGPNLCIVVFLVRHEVNDVHPLSFVICQGVLCIRIAAEAIPSKEQYVDCIVLIQVENVPLGESGQDVHGSPGSDLMRNYTSQSKPCRLHQGYHGSHAGQD